MPDARQIDVKTQKALSLGKSMRFCLKGISHRLFRSALTLSVVVLAVAFFMSLLTESVFIRSIAGGVASEIAVQREAALKMNLLFSALPPSMASRMLAGAKGDPAALEELSRISGVALERVGNLSSQASTEQTYYEFFDRMGVGQRHILIKKSKGKEIFAFLSDNSNWRQFTELLEPLRSLKLPTRAEDFKLFIDSFPQFEKDLQDFSSRWGRKIDSVNKSTREMVEASPLEIWLCCANPEEIVAMASESPEGQSQGDVKKRVKRLQSLLKKIHSSGVPSKRSNEPREAAKLLELLQRPGPEELKALLSKVRIEDWLCFAPDAAFSDWVKLLQDSGFSVDYPMMSRIRSSLREAKTRDDIATALNSKEKRDEWKRVFLNNPPLDAKMRSLGSEAVAKLLDGEYSVARLKEVSRSVEEERRLSFLERELSGRMDRKSGGILSGRQLFLLLISFVVCMVGIANAMLMAITERFREIATMKCLGATDGFILTQFLLEAAIQGVCGGVAGTLIGFALSLLKSSLVFGTHVFAHFPSLGVASCAAISLAAGVALSMLASIYPSWSASRMAPMEAMRVE